MNIQLILTTKNNEGKLDEEFPSKNGALIK